MKKRLVSFVISTALILSCLPATAAGGALTGYVVDNGIYVEYKGGANAVLNIYEDNALVFSNSTEKEPGGYFFSVPDEYTDGRIRMYCVGIGIFDVELTEYDATSSATTVTETASPTPVEATATTAATAATAVPEKTPIPEVYERNLDAVNAPAVVQSVSVQKIDGETYYVTKMLYQGVEITHNIRDHITIDSAPSRYAELKGQPASELKEGDVIHFTCNLQHLIKSIDLIYRPDFENYIISGSDYGTRYSKLVGKDGYNVYAFGAPVKTGKGYVLLADVNGKTTEVDVAGKAFVYAVSANARKDKAELRGTGATAISKVYMRNTNFDDNDNVISWEDVDITSYALVRIAGGTATEVFVFEY